MVMPANNRKAIVHYWGGRYPGRIGHLYGPGGFGSAYPWLPYALDNGAFPAFTNGREWERGPFLSLLAAASASDQQPLWVAVPDVVADKDATIAKWAEWSRALRVSYGWPLAFCVQDGMVPSDVPVDADVVFVGGSTAWKWETVPMWASAFPRVHVGRVNSPRRLWELEALGVESCDGTGWFRGDDAQTSGLAAFMERA